MGETIDGKEKARQLREATAAEAAALHKSHSLVPGLAVVLLGEDPASQIYVRRKQEQAKEAGFNSFEHVLPHSTSAEELIALVEKLNEDKSVHGILVQLPLPGHIDEEPVIAAISPDKDVDGFHVVNVGRLARGDTALVPCTPLGCTMLLNDCLGDLSGLDAVIVGRSNIVGKPLAALLLAQNCTVTIAHSRTRDLPEVCRRADILIAAVGVPNLIRGDWIKRGATVIDVGINRIDAGNGKTRLVGDVEFETALPRAAHITPVPGGVGPMTIACLLSNTLSAAKRLEGIV